MFSFAALNRSNEFASRPGMCPTMDVEALNNVSCTLDVDCPEHKKCCEASQRTVCSEPVPEGITVANFLFSASRFGAKTIIMREPLGVSYPDHKWEPLEQLRFGG